MAHADQMLEILASVSPCREQPFGALRNLVLEHTAAVSGCICIFVDWDERRKELVRQLQAMGLPLLVFVVRGAGASEPLDPGPLRDAPETFHALEAGKMAEGLGKL